MRLVALAAILFTTAVHAADVDFSTVITDQDGTAVMDCSGAGKECEGKPEITLGRVCARALWATYNDELNLSGEEKFKRGKLAEKVYGGGVVPVSAEDVALIKRLVAKGYGPLIVLRAWSLLDPPAR